MDNIYDFITLNDTKLNTLHEIVKANEEYQPKASTNTTIQGNEDLNIINLERSMRIKHRRDKYKIVIPLLLLSIIGIGLTIPIHWYKKSEESTTNVDNVTVSMDSQSEEGMGEGCDINPCESYEICNSEYQCVCANGKDICVEDIHCTLEYGPHGGVCGIEFTDYSIKPFGFITAIHVCFETKIVHSIEGIKDLRDCIGMTYGNMQGTCHGNGRGTKVLLKNGEYITAVSGRLYDYCDGISQLNFSTNLRTLGPYGKTSSESSVFNVDSGGKKLAFISGKGGMIIDQLKFHFYC